MGGTGLQGAVLSAESRAGAAAAPLRRGGRVACTAGSGLTGTWKKDKVPTAFQDVHPLHESWSAQYAM